MLGCLAMGVLTSYLGGFTTFSHLMDDVYTLGDGGEPGLGIAYALVSVAVGWAAIGVGLALGRKAPHRGAP